MDPNRKTLPLLLDSAVLTAETIANLARTPMGVMALALVLIINAFRYVPEVAPSNQSTIIMLLLFVFVLVFFAFCWILVRHRDKLMPPPQRYSRRLLERAAGSRNLPRTPNGPMVVPATPMLRVPEVLWVDDNPSNNELEFRVLVANGLRIKQVRSTGEALQEVERKPYALILSDMERDQKPSEGYALLRQLRSVNCETPFIVYTSTTSMEDKKRILAEGGQGHTNDPRELIQLVMRELVPRASGNIGSGNTRASIEGANT